MPARKLDKPTYSGMEVLAKAAEQTAKAKKSPRFEQIAQRIRKALRVH